MEKDDRTHRSPMLGVRRWIRLRRLYVRRPGQSVITACRSVMVVETCRQDARSAVRCSGGCTSDPMSPTTSPLSAKNLLRHAAVRHGWSVRTYREIFGIPEFRMLFVARSFLMAGVVLGGLALGTLIYQTTGSPVLTALAMFGGPLVQLVTSHFLLATADLVRPRSAMVLVGLTAGGTDLLQTIPAMAWGWRFGLLAVGYVVVAATSGTVIGLLSDLVPPEAFVLGRATLNITVGGMQVLGNALGAVLLLVMSTSHLFFLSGTVGIVGALVARLGLGDHPPRTTGRVLRRTREVNRALLSSRVVRPIYLMMWVPNGLVVGCEALFIPYAADHAGYLFGAGALGMLAGDVVVGRFVPEALRDRLIVPLRLLLAVPFLAFALHPPLWLACGLALVASFGYAAALPVQERLVGHTAPDARGQVFGLAGAGLMLGQAFGAILAGVVAQYLGSGSVAAGQTMLVMAVLSLIATFAVLPGLRSSDPALVSSG
jgi:predicted MFS family arabinose efflux permease